jgi:uncharacterized membrane protein
MADIEVRGGGASATAPGEGRRTGEGAGARRGPSPVVAGVLLGVGFGGFVDGIVLHQVLQWHHMLTSTDDNPADTVAGLEANTVADGLFHMATWLFLVAGVIVLRKAWASGRPAPRWPAQLGAMMIGWGLFNLVEGVVDHHLLNVHNVRDDVADPLWWNLGFLAFGAVLVLAGLALVRGAAARDGAARDVSPARTG